jgi:transposase
MKKTQITSMTTSEIEELLKSKDDYKVALRLLCMLSLSKGESTRKTQDLIRLSHNQIAIWAKRFNSEGIDGLKDKTKSGRKSKLNFEQLDWLRNLILNSSPLEFGYNTEIWTAPMLIEQIQNNCNVKYSDDAIYIILKNKLNLRHKKSKGFYAEANEKKREDFVETLKKTPRST